MTTTTADLDIAEPADESPAELAVRHDVAGRVARARERLVVPMPNDRYWGWLAPLAVTALAALLRFWELGRPAKIAFDETYYVKGALSLAQFGYERDAIAKADDLVAKGNSDVFTEKADFVVHPPLGKWVISLGTDAFGVNPTAWRVMTALLGTLLVLMVCRVGRRLFRSTLIGCAAGLLVAIDGVAIVLSRIALLDGILAFFAFAAFGCLLVDRDWSRRTLAERLADSKLTDRGRFVLGPSLGWRPWRIAAGVMLGLACGVKWSGIWFAVAFGLMTVLWDMGARRTAGIAKPFRAAVIRDALPAFISLIVVAAGVYVLTWTGWFVTSGGWDRHWADDRATAWPFIPDAVRSLWHYHAEMLRFHTGLTTPHPYQSNPWGWTILSRPTAVFYENVGGCGSDKCTSAVTAVGNPVLWWGGTAAMVWLVFEWLGRRDWRAGAILSGFAAGWLSWVILEGDKGRTVFAFYAVAFVPFMALALAYVLGRILGPPDATPRRRAWGAAGLGTVLALACLAAAFFYPIWSGDPISYAEWGRRMWFKSWI